MALPQEILIGVRSVNLHVACRAFLKFRVQQVVSRGLYIHALVARTRSAAVMAFQAEREHHGASEQLCISRAMWIVT